MSKRSPDAVAATPAAPNDPQKLVAGVRTTGFVLENQTAQALKAASWSVISNRYYVDEEAKETVREVDLVAYKCSRVQHFDVYTVLIISCKKDHTNAWALMARDINAKDPNADWWPVHSWTNDRALEFQLSRPGKARRYHDDVSELGVTQVMRLPQVEVFAFQTLNAQSGAASNDRDIFSSVSTLMKAQAYEKSSLQDRRKGKPSIYQFNLITVVDAHLVRMMFRGQDITCEPVDSEQYLARYIIKRKDTFARIRFIKAACFADSLEDYARLHTANCRWAGDECNAFYNDAVKDDDRISVFADEFKKRCASIIYWNTSDAVRGSLKGGFDALRPWMFWGEKTQQLHICVDASVEVINELNATKSIRLKVAKLLQDLYRYEAEFSFSEDIPF